MLLFCELIPIFSKTFKNGIDAPPTLALAFPWIACGNSSKSFWWDFNENKKENKNENYYS